jgi:hypothetical protein
MASYYLIEAKNLISGKQHRIKLTYLHYPSDNLIIANPIRSNTKTVVEDFFLMADIKTKGYGYDEKKNAYIFITDTYEPLRELKVFSKRYTPLSGSDHKFYNKAEKHERAYLPKRKTVRTYKKK